MLQKNFNLLLVPDFSVNLTAKAGRKNDSCVVSYGSIFASLELQHAVDWEHHRRVSNSIFDSEKLSPFFRVVLAGSEPRSIG